MILGVGFLFKTVVICVLGASIGFWSGWKVNHSRYGQVGGFGPFLMTNEVTAKTVSDYVKPRIQTGSPRIEVVGGEEYDFGVMEPDATGKHNFVVRNTGEGPLTLEIIGSTCKCTVGTLENSSVAPGEETEVELTWTVKTIGEDFGQSATLKSNDPARGELSLKIKGRVVSQMTMVPRGFSFGEVEATDEIALESTVYSFMNDKVKPTEMKFSDAYMNELSTLTVEEIDVNSIEDPTYASAKQAFKVSGVLRQGMAQGPIQQNFEFGFVPVSKLKDDGTFDEEDQMFLTTTVGGKIVGAMALVESSRCQRLSSGEYIYTIGRVEPKTAKPEKANIMLRGQNKETIKLSLGDVEPKDMLRAELGDPVGRGSVILYPLKLWLDPELKSGERTGRNDDDYGYVTVQTDNEDVPPLRIKIRFAVAKP